MTRLAESLTHSLFSEQALLRHELVYLGVVHLHRVFLAQLSNPLLFQIGLVVAGGLATGFGQGFGTSRQGFVDDDGVVAAVFLGGVGAGRAGQHFVHHFVVAFLKDALRHLYRQRVLLVEHGFEGGRGAAHHRNLSRGISGGARAHSRLQATGRNAALAAQVAHGRVATRFSQGSFFALFHAANQRHSAQGVLHHEAGYFVEAHPAGFGKYSGVGAEGCRFGQVFGNCIAASLQLFLRAGQQSWRSSADERALYALVPLVLGLVFREVLLQAHGVFNSLAPYFLVHQLEQQYTVAVLLHQHAVVLILGVEAIFLKLGEALVHVLVVELLHHKLGVGTGAGPLVLLGKSQEVLDGVGLALDGKQRHVVVLTFAAFGRCRRSRVLESAIHQGRISLAQHVGFRSRNFHELVFLAHALEESSAVELRAGVFGHLAFQRGLHVHELRHGLLFNQLDNVPAVGRLHRAGQVAGLLHLESRLLEGGNHAAGAEGRQLPAVGGRAGIFRELSHQLVPVLALLQAGVELVNFLFGRQRVGRGGVAVHAHHQVGHLHFALCRALVVHLDEVVAKACAHRGRNLAYGRLIGHGFKRIHHLHSREVAQLAGVILGRRVFAYLAGQGRKVLAAGQLLAELLNFLVGSQGVLRSRVRCNAYQDVRGIDFLAHAVVGLLHQLVRHAFLREVGLGQLLAVAVELALECLGGVETFLLGFQHFEAEVGIEVEVFVYALAGAILRSRAVVLTIHVSKLAGWHGVGAQGFDYGTSSGRSGCGCLSGGLRR